MVHDRIARENSQTNNHKLATTLARISGAKNGAAPFIALFLAKRCLSKDRQ